MTTTLAQKTRLPRSEKLIPLCLVVILAAHFSIGTDLRYSLLKSYDPPVQAVLASVVEGNPARRLTLALLCVGVLLYFLTNPKIYLRKSGGLGYLALSFAAWSVLSIVWTADPGFVLRRVAVFFTLCLVSVALANEYSIDSLLRFTVFSMALYLFIGLGAEMVFRTFKPFSPGYRFSGTVHPNVQGFDCAALFLAATTLASSSRAGRSLSSRACWLLYLGIATAAFVGIVLTKSRTSTATAIMVQVLLWALGPGRSRKVVPVAIAIWLAMMVFLVAGDRFLPNVYNAVLLGRGTANVNTFTGRTLLWRHVLPYIGERPLLGHGFNSFWNFRHIADFSALMGIGLVDAHSIYLDLLLSVGLVGALLYVVTMLCAAKASLQLFRRSGQFGYAFFFKLSIFCLLQGLLESGTLEGGIGTLLLIWGTVHVAYRSSALPAG